MGRKVISVSITEEQDKFCAENDIKPSAILQNELNKLMESKLSPEFLKQLQEEKLIIESNLNKWKDLFYSTKDWIEKRGLYEEYNKEVLL